MRRQSHERELQRLQDDLVILGNMVGTAIVKSVESLQQPDFESVERLAAQTRLIHKKRFRIETSAFVLIATERWPPAELRSLTATLEIAAELERMGDYASGIARIGAMADVQPRSSSFAAVCKLAQKVQDLLYRALRAFVRQDPELARAIARERGELYDLYHLRRNLLAGDESTSRSTDGSANLRWVTYKLERTANRVTNICGWVVFVVTGEMTALDVEIDKPPSL